MKSIVIGMLAVILFISMAIFAVDYYFFLVNRYCRFHIGRWENDTKWENSVYKIVVKWSKRTPTVKITDNTRYVLLDMLQGKYRSASIQSWQNAALILGLLEKKDTLNAKKSVERFVDNKGEWKKAPTAVDAGLLAYAILKTVDNPDRVKPAMDFMVALIGKNLDEKGLVSYTGGGINPERYVDTLGLVCPFLALYANVYNQPQYETLAFNQLKFYHEYGMFADTDLPNHAVDAITYLPLGVYGWGRGVAWYTIGLIDTFFELKNDLYRREVSAWIKEAADAYLVYQQPDGGFGSIIQRKNTYDSSATAAMAYFYAQSANVFVCQSYAEAAKRCLKKLKSVTRITGKIDWCQGDTKGIGIFAQTYDIMPFAQGMALRAIELQRRVKTNDSKIQN